MTRFGILNITPDSFSDGSMQMLDPNFAFEKAQKLIDSGFDVIDVGAESTRPGAYTLNVTDELNRLIPFLIKFRTEYPYFPLSIDTRKAFVLREVLKFDIQYINDVSGFQHPDMAQVLSYTDKVRIIAMHSKGGVPPTKRSTEIKNDFYGEDGLFQHMKKFFAKSIDNAIKNDIDRSRLILDPGLGFGKNIKQSLEILELIPKLREEFGLEIFIGASRKSFLKAIIKDGKKNNLGITKDTDIDKASELYHQKALEQGADYIRQH